MSSEKNLNIEENNLTPFETLQKNRKTLSGRVDINVLLIRARKVKNKETRTNFVFFGLIISLIFVGGMILSF